jgi:hypothetical protein
MTFRTLFLTCATISFIALAWLLISPSATVTVSLPEKRSVVADSWMQQFQACVKELPDGATHAELAKCSDEADGKAGVR